MQVPEPNAEAAARLADMGFPDAVARRALLLTRNRLDAATEWCLLLLPPSAIAAGSHVPNKSLSEFTSQNRTQQSSTQA